tara:strand:- start:93 stop:425 length:333 start_codon:yes stop_codon:yes gene_type:complete
MVADCPVKDAVTSPTIIGVPKEVVAETPVSPITSAGSKAPTLVVAETPVSPIVGFEEIVTLPSLAVAETPVKEAVTSATAITVPKEVVAETPVKGTPISIFKDPMVEVAD